MDALDEAGEDVATELVSHFRRFASLSSNLGICFSCRHYPDVTLNEGSIICMEDENKSDIETYVQQKLGIAFYDKLYAKEVQGHILNKAQGSVQCVSIVVAIAIRLYKRGRNKKFILKQLHDVPVALHSLYDNLLSSVEERAQALQLMQWIAFARRPLSTYELQHAMAVDAHSSYTILSECKDSLTFMGPDEIERRVSSLSAGLAEFKRHGSTRVAGFIHHSVYDYIIERGLLSLGSSPSQDVVVEAHMRLMASCVKYIALEEVMIHATAISDRFKAITNQKDEITDEPIGKDTEQIDENSYESGS